MPWLNLTITLALLQALVFGGCALVFVGYVADQRPLLGFRQIRRSPSSQS